MYTLYRAYPRNARMRDLSLLLGMLRGLAATSGGYPTIAGQSFEVLLKNGRVCFRFRRQRGGSRFARVARQLLGQVFRVVRVRRRRW